MTRQHHVQLCIPDHIPHTDRCCSAFARVQKATPLAYIEWNGLSAAWLGHGYWNLEHGAPGLRGPSTSEDRVAPGGVSWARAEALAEELPYLNTGRRMDRA